MWRTHGISLKRHLRMRLLLQLSSKANNTSKVAQCQWWWYNTSCCPDSIKEGAMVIVVKRDDVPEHTTVTGWTAMVAEVWDKMKTLQRKEQVNSMKLSIHPCIQSSAEEISNDGEQKVLLLWTKGQMDVLTDTEMSDRCTNVQMLPQKSPCHMGCTDSPSKFPWHMGNILVYGDMQMYRGHTGVWACTDIWGSHTGGMYRCPHNPLHACQLNELGYPLFKLNSYT